MRWTRIAVLGSMIGCSYPSLAPVAGEPVDALAGPPVDDRTCFGTGRFEVCLTAPPAGEVAISTNTAINTDSSPMCTSTTETAAGYCVIAAADLTVSAKLAATGSRPLVLLASHTLAVTKTGTVDVGSHVNLVGAGADPMGCASGTPLSGAGGGAGGSFFSLGGRGGSDGNGLNGGSPGAAVTFIAQMRGGCPGQQGSAVHPCGNPHANGGHGGGAVYLIAGGALDIAGSVLATGQGGGGGPPITTNGTLILGGASGGGGGAGGMIGLDAPMVTASGLLLASGGGGGGGGYSASGSAGADPTGVAAAAGGAGDPTSDSVATGGTGSPPTFTVQSSAGHDAVATSCQVPAGGGGGGGGAGVIYAPASAKLTNLSPPATVP